jgi:outer membrane lipase/esterase
MSAAAVAAGAILLVSCGGEGFDSAPTPPTYGTTVVVGASLSDTGNACNLSTAGCPTAGVGYSGNRFSNGPLYVEAVAASYGASVTPSRTGGNNFAYAGARTGNVRAALDVAMLQAVTLSAATGTLPTVPGMNSATGTNASQIDALLTKFNFQIPPQTLVIVDAATMGNNISDALTLSAVFPANAAQIGPAIVTGAVTDIVGIINRLYAAGARTMVVVNVPNIGQTPRVQSIPDVPVGARAAAIAGAMSLSQGFNGALAQQVNGLRAVLTGSNIILFDLYALEASIKAGTAPGQPAFTNTTAACVDAAAVPPVCATPATYFYWDSFHPTAALGAYVASRVVAAIPAP